MSEDYLHGYTPEEQERLVSQAGYLEPWIFARIDFDKARSVLEVGCGVGAQMAILGRRFPGLKLTGADRSAAQIAAARQVLAGEIAAGRAELVHADGTRLPFADGSFDGGFLCWVLEHAAEPLGLLGEMRRVLAPGATLYSTEVFNDSLFVRPRCAGLEEYWARFNEFQSELKGDPQVGVKVPSLLDEAGFAAIESWPVPFHLDRRWRDTETRLVFLDYWHVLCRSAAAGLLAAGKIDDELVKRLSTDFARLKADRNAVFYVQAMQTRAKVPATF